MTDIHALPEGANGLPQAEAYEVRQLADGSWVLLLSVKKFTIELPLSIQDAAALVMTIGAALQEMQTSYGETGEHINKADIRADAMPTDETLAAVSQFVARSRLEFPSVRSALRVSAASLIACAADITRNVIEPATVDTALCNAALWVRVIEESDQLSVEGRLV